MQDVTARDAGPACDQNQVEASWNQLNLTLGFFTRVDMRLSAVLALNLGMLGLAGGRWPAWEEVSVRALCVTAGFLIPLCISFQRLWIAIVPDRRGGTGSLVYFGSIATMHESDFRSHFMSRSSHDLACDLLDQAWRNARILQKKFDALRDACWSMAFAVPAWVWLLMELPAKTAS